MRVGRFDGLGIAVDCGSSAAIVAIVVDFGKARYVGWR